MNIINYFQEKFGKVPTGEVAVTKSQLTGLSFLPYNPDDLVRAKGKGLKLYQEITREPFIKAALLQKKTKLLKVGWDVIPASKDPKHIEQAAFIKWNLGTRLAGSFSRDLYEMCDALDNGFSVSEKVFEIVEKGKWKDKAAYKNLKSKNPDFFDFDTDDFGNLKKDGLLLSNPILGYHQKSLNASKFVIFAYLMRYENLYGQSDLRAAYRAYWLKDTAWKLRAIYMERFAGNNLKGQYPAKDEKSKEKLLELFRTWQQETGIAIPDTCEVEVLQMATSSKSEYEATIADCNKEIQVGILGQILTMDTGAKGNGSRALGQVHSGVLDDFVWFLDEIIKADVNLQIIRPLIDLNWETDEYPTWTFKSREGFDGEKFSRTLLNLSRITGMDIPIRWAKEKYRIPEPEKDEEVIKGIQLGVAGGGSQQHPAAVAAPPDNSNGKKPPAPAAAKMKELSPSSFEGKGVYFREFNKFELFAELTKIDEETEALVKESKDASVPIYEAIKADILKQVEKKKIFETGDFDAIEKVTINIGPLKQLMADSFLNARLIGRSDIMKQAAIEEDKFAEEFIPDKALAALAKKIGMTKSEFNALSSEVKAQAFTVAGLEKSTIDKEVKSLLLQSLKEGDDFKAFNFKLNEKFIKYATPVYAGVGAVGDTIVDFHAETVFRNGVMDAYNEGRHEQLLDPDVMEIFPAMMLSAVRDGRTRPLHLKADGLIFMVDDPIWRTLRPPNGHNCREVLIPISKWDFTRDMLSSRVDIPRGYPEAGFGG